MSELREWWIQLGTPDMIGDSFQEAESFCTGHRIEVPIHHVIEYSAYQTAVQERASARAELKLVREACEAAIKERDEARAALNHPTSERIGSLIRERDEAQTIIKNQKEYVVDAAERAIAERAKSAKLVEALEKIKALAEYRETKE